MAKTTFTRRPTLYTAFEDQTKRQAKLEQTVTRYTNRVFTGLSKTGMNATGTRYVLAEAGFVLPRTGILEVFAALTLTDSRTLAAGREAGLYARVDDGTTQSEGRLLKWDAPSSAEQRWTTAGSNVGITSNPGSYIVRFWDLPAGGYTINFNVQMFGTGTINASCTAGICAYRII